MIHIGTVHYRDDRWIGVQRRYLDRFTSEPYRLYASLDGLEARHLAAFDHAVDHTDLAPEHHPGLRIERKLNVLCSEMAQRAAPEELLVVMHGDTLPVADWVAAVRPMVAEAELAAIRRDENGEPIPHWSFCTTTAGFWTEIEGNWDRGPSWEFLGARVTDTGAKLMEVLRSRGVDWHPILRTNRVNLHPLWFGIYGDILYHHGAGFRAPMSRLDAGGYAHLPIGLRNLAGVRRRLVNTVRSRRMYRSVRSDEDFYRALMAAGPG